MMPEEMRKSGIDVIGDVPWGMHFCQFYETKKDLTDILVPYFKTGLENNESCMWVTANPLNAADARRALKRATPDFQKYLAKGQIEIIPYSDWYIKDGAFDFDRVLNGWVDKLNAALACGFAGLRLTGNTFWLEPANWASFTDYETAVDKVIGSYRMIALCTYSLAKCGAFELLDVISNHRFALIKRAGRWQTIESTRDRELRQALTKSQERYSALFNGTNEGVAFHEIIMDAQGQPADYRFLEVNAAFEKITGLSAERVIGKAAREAIPGLEESWIKQYGKVALTGEPAVFENYSAGLGKWFEVYAYSPQKGYFATLFMDVTERKKQQEATESLASFPAENPNPVIRIGRDGAVIYANEASKTILQYWQCQVGALLPAAYFKQVQMALTSRNTQRDDVDCDGRIYALTFAPVEGKDYVNIYGRDVTERRRAEEALRETRDYLDNLLNYANAPIIVWDPSFRITLFNRAFERLTGRKAAEVISAQLDILFPVERREESMELIRRALAGERWEAVEIPILRLDGEVRAVVWNSATLYETDGRTPLATIAQGQDVTERKRAEEALQLRTDELARSNAELEQFAYVASHDLQEPLRMISSYVQLLGNRYRGKLDNDADDFIHYATDGATRMQKLINDLLAYSRVGTRGKKSETVSLESALSQALDNLKVTVRDNGAVVTHDPLPVVRGDAGQLAQVFQNLIDNAVKFHGDTPPRVHVTAEIRGGECVCSVRDNGIGIAPEYTGRLFLLFQRLHTRQEYTGTGIGLAICKRIIERHGGRIWVESTPGVGSTFYFSVPIANEEMTHDRRRG